MKFHLPGIPPTAQVYFKLYLTKLYFSTQKTNKLESLANHPKTKEIKTKKNNPLLSQFPSLVVKDYDR